MGSPISPYGFAILTGYVTSDVIEYEKYIHDRKNPGYSFIEKTHGRDRQTGTMHPDDFKAHLAWVLAKRMLNQ